VVRNPVKAAGVAVINFKKWPVWAFAVFYTLFGMSIPLMAAILPEERADLLYHRYSGDHVTVDGPSLLARKNFGKHTSVYAGYYSDSVTSASIDVRTAASQYTESRTEYNYGFDWLYDNVDISLGLTNSEENDYSSNTYHFGISQTMFGDLTTVSLGISYGDDTVRKNLRDINGKFIGNDPNFGENGEEKLQRRNYKLGVTQILTKNLIMNFGFEAITDQGYTQNPYRNAFQYDPAITNIINGAREPVAIAEDYPDARTSDAIAVRANYFLPYRASIHTEYKYYTDTWGLRAHTFKIGYVQPFLDQWTFDVSYRYYKQKQADFYKDVYAETDLNLKYYGHDKELSSYDSRSFGVKASYLFLQNSWWMIDKGSVNFSFEKITFNFENFSSFSKDSQDLQYYGDPFQFDADVIQFFISVYY